MPIHLPSSCKSNLVKIEDAHPLPMFKPALVLQRLPNEVHTPGLSPALFLTALKNNLDYVQNLRAFRL